jgi:hypothetical protein
VLAGQDAQGGSHYYFRPHERAQHGGARFAELLPSEYVEQLPKAGNHRVRTGIDVRGRGGYVLLPPSRSEDGRYQWFHFKASHELPKWPEWALRLGNTTLFSSLGVGDEKKVVRAAGADVEPSGNGVGRHRIPYGVQHDTLVWDAFALKYRGWSEEAIHSAIAAWEKLECERPGPPENIRRIAQSVYRSDGQCRVRTLIGEPARRESPFSYVQFSLDMIRAPRWAFDGYLLMGALNLITGTGDAGKGTLISWVIAQLTRGLLPGSLQGQPAHCLVVGDEDDIGSAWVPQIAAAGGNVDFVGGLSYDAGRPLNPERDIEHLEALVVEKSSRLVYLDQILDHLCSERNANSQHDVRAALARLRSLARRHELAAVYTQHPRKGLMGASLRERAGASGQFSDLPRSGLVVGYHPDPERAGLRAFGRDKGNVGITPPSMSFRIRGSLSQARPLRKLSTSGSLTTCKWSPAFSPKRSCSTHRRQRRRACTSEA